MLHKDLKNMFIKVRRLWQASEIGVRPVPQEINKYKIFDTIIKSQNNSNTRHGGCLLPMEDACHNLYTHVYATTPS